MLEIADRVGFILQIGDTSYLIVVKTDVGYGCTVGSRNPQIGRVCTPVCMQIVDGSKPRDDTRTRAHLRSSAIALLLVISEPSSVELVVVRENVWMVAVITRKEQREIGIMRG